MEKNREKAWEQNYVMDRKWWTQLVRNVDSVCTTESTISGPWRSFAPRPSPDFFPRLRDKSGRGLGTRLWLYCVIDELLRAQIFKNLLNIIILILNVGSPLVQVCLGQRVFSLDEWTFDQTMCVCVRVSITHIANVLLLELVAVLVYLPCFSYWSRCFDCQIWASVVKTLAHLFTFDKCKHFRPHNGLYNNF